MASRIMLHVQTTLIGDQSDGSPQPEGHQEPTALPEKWNPRSVLRALVRRARQLPRQVPRRRRSPRHPSSFAPSLNADRICNGWSGARTHPSADAHGSSFHVVGPWSPDRKSRGGSHLLRAQQRVLSRPLPYHRHLRQCERNHQRSANHVKHGPVPHSRPIARAGARDFAKTRSTGPVESVRY
jgi:hypothetical protein